MVSRFLPWFSQEVDRLFMQAKPLFPGRLFRESKMESFYWQEPTLAICEARLRPRNEYYSHHELPVPIPENPKGKHASGIEIGFKLNRANEIRKTTYPPEIEVHFRVWGRRERSAFDCLFQDYRRLIMLLLRGVPFRFQTACWFENVEAYKGRDVSKKLELYLLNKDEENNFVLSSVFTGDVDPNSMFRVLLRVLILYDCCYGYAKRKQDLDRILYYFQRLHI